MVTIMQSTNSIANTHNPESWCCLNHTLFYLSFLLSSSSIYFRTFFSFFASFPFLCLFPLLLASSTHHEHLWLMKIIKKINSLLFDTLLHVGSVGIVETSSIPTKISIIAKSKIWASLCIASAAVVFWSELMMKRLHISEILYLPMQTRAGLSRTMMGGEWFLNPSSCSVEVLCKALSACMSW